MTVRSRWAVALLAVLLAALATGAPAGAQTATAGAGSSTAASPTQETIAGRPRAPRRADVAPPGRSRSAQQVLAIADRLAKVQEAQARAPGLHPRGVPEGAGALAGLLHRRQGRRPHGDRAGARRRPLRRGARGVDGLPGRPGRWPAATTGAFGRKVNSPWVWIPLCILFVVPFVDVRRPWRMLHLDLLVLTGFSVGARVLQRARTSGISTPLVVPLLVYLLVRMLQIGWSRPGPGRQARRPLAAARARVLAGGRRRLPARLPRSG